MARPRDPRRWLPGSPRRPTKVYVAWVAMRQRCRNPKVERFARYGERGIGICDRWSSFDCFYTDMGDPPPGATLERLNVHADYGPENCVWADRHAQANNKTSNHWITFRGQRKTMAQWSEDLQIPYSRLRARLQRGWTVERALTEPLAYGRRRPTRLPR